MTAVRRLALAALTVAVGCTRPFLALEPVPPPGGGNDPIAAVSLFLIGDAGSVAPGDRVLAELVRQGRAASRSSAVVFLGDNAYPRGIPPETDPGFGEARRRLLQLAAVADSTGLRLVFIPGNHDWNRHSAGGWEQIRRQEALLRDYAVSRGVGVELVPTGGCPGPVTIPVTDALKLVAIDTQWWLQGPARRGPASAAELDTLQDPAVRCPYDSESAVVSALRRINEERTVPVTVVVGHHPLESHGEHGAHYPWVQWVFPLVPTPIAPWAWLPIGWIYPLGRKLVGHPQDLQSSVNRAMREAIIGTFSEHSPLIYVSGHDHSLEVIRHGAGHFLLVSGSGSEGHQSSVGRSDSTAYAASEPGFMRVDLLENGRVRLGVTVVHPSGKVEEAFRAWLK